MPLGLTRQVNDRFGALFVGLDATPTGSNPTEDVVADFTGATVTHFPDISDTTPIFHTPSQTLGSTFKITVRGLWLVTAEVPVVTAATVIAALNYEGLAADLNVAPLATTVRNRRRALWTGAAAGDADTLQVSAPILVTDSSARAPSSTGLGIVRLLLSDAAGAGAAAASLAPLASCRLQFDWVCDVPPGSH